MDTREELVSSHCTRVATCDDTAPRAVLVVSGPPAKVVWARPGTRAGPGRIIRWHAYI